MEACDSALVEIGQLLRGLDYRFTTITPESHARVRARMRNGEAQSMRDIFGWSMAFRSELLSSRMLELLRQADALEAIDAERYRSRVRYSTLDDGLYVHSAYPTTHQDAVFFGPDSYRFVSLLRRKVADARRVVDVGCGSGIGGLSIAARCARVTLTDINPLAVRYARVNAKLTSSPNVDFTVGSLLDNVDGEIDLVVANPPYLIDQEQRSYRHGGNAHGAELSARIVEQSLIRVGRGGRLVLYTGAAIVNGGKDTFLELVTPMLERARADFEYEELDPDVFGTELEHPAYADVERIAAVSLIVQKR